MATPGDIKSIVTSSNVQSSLMFVIAMSFRDVIESFIESVIIPLFFSDDDKKEFEDETVEIWGIQFKLGKLTIDVMTFAIMILALGYVISRMRLNNVSI